jgi:hypothetical protein
MTKVTPSRIKKISAARAQNPRHSPRITHVGHAGPISNAEAATPTLRLLMWQPTPSRKPSPPFSSARNSPLHFLTAI